MHIVHCNLTAGALWERGRGGPALVQAAAIGIVHDGHDPASLVHQRDLHDQNRPPAEVRSATFWAGAIRRQSASHRAASPRHSRGAACAPLGPSG
eukprot:scaffold3071_cov59-Phaeocystis_antarctica.AAC.4